ncbi:hypothetical protein ACFUS2_00605 [[Kitasatospora] papulosa]|uniref:hypothetical protein n=1 Tax=[Kitasatospora] papulosa TaxID=1464011 RepID=UPI0036423C2A
MTAHARFNYRGPAAIDGVQFADVHLHEDPPEGGLRSWEGETTFPLSDTPEGFTPALVDTERVTVRLPDGREGTALVTDLQLDGQSWTVILQGSGPAPH